jgi:hypothetical protein
MSYTTFTTYTQPIYLNRAELEKFVFAPGPLPIDCETMYVAVRVEAGGDMITVGACLEGNMPRATFLLQPYSLASDCLVRLYLP